MNKIVKEQVLILGFGDIAKRVVQWLEKDTCAHYELTGVRRSLIKDEKINMISADVSRQEEMDAIFKKHFDVIIITMTPSEMSDAGYKKGYVDTTNTILRSLIKNKVKPRLILFVSSTSVYGQKNAEWVDELSKTEPSTYSGRRLLEAETALAESPFPICIVRFSGIYGPGRQRLIQQVIEGHGAEQEPVLYSNRIHAEDCAGVLVFLMKKNKNEKIQNLYIATDSDPAPLFDVKNWLAEQLNLPAGHLQPKPLGRSLRSSKRCINKRLLNSGYEFIYPSYKQGYLSILKDIENESLEK